MRVAVLLTTFNRKDKTLGCLKTLQRQELPDGTEIDVFLTDDASADNTAAEAAAAYAGINIFKGTGSLFWAGGMRTSWSQALKGNYDYYLLLNDDTTLKPEAISVLVNSSVKAFEVNGIANICIGSTCNPDTGLISYGGKVVTSRTFFKSSTVYSESSPLDCDLGNANIMLVSRGVVNKIGILSDKFTHGIADYDYTLRAKEAGLKVIVVPGMLGYCNNDHGQSWKPQKSKLAERISYLKSPKGLAYYEYMGFIKSHFPRYYPLAYVKLWMKTFFPIFWTLYKKQ
jgi:GT2 family glycosyltransferase